MCLCTHTHACINSCPCENTPGRPSAYCMRRIGLCTRDYGRILVGMVHT